MTFGIEYKTLVVQIKCLLIINIKDIYFKVIIWCVWYVMVFLRINTNLRTIEMDVLLFSCKN